MADERPEVLVVDDDADMRDILDTALTSLGYQTYVADDGDIAWDLFQEHHPNLVLSDIYMPRFDGVKLMRQIKEASPDTKVILITGYSNMDAKAAANDVKPDAMLRKPFNMGELFSTIKSVVSDGTK